MGIPAETYLPAPFLAKAPLLATVEVPSQNLRSGDAPYAHSCIGTQRQLQIILRTFNK